MTNYTAEDERRAHIENMDADTEYKRGLARYEPWKVILTAVGTTAAVLLALLAVATFILSHFIR